MAQTKVKLISDGVIVQSNLHASHGITTAHIGEGSNLYYTDARSRAAISVSGNALSYNSSTGVITSNFEESPVFTGDVVIGTSTTTPSAHYNNLVIEDVAGNNVGISLISGTGNNTALYFGDSADTDVAQLKYSHATNTMFFVVNASEAMRIDSSGNIGIGATSPAAKLHVVGEARVYTGSSLGYWGVDAGNSYVYLGTNTSNYSLSFQTSGSERMRIDSSGNVGIGGNNSSYKLISIGDYYPIAWQRSGGTIGTLYSDSTSVGIGVSNLNNAGVFFTSGQHIDFRVNGGTKMFLNSSGNLGIGTTNPTSPTSVDRFLSIEGSTAGIVLSDSSDPNYKWDIWNSSGGLFMKYNDTTFGISQLSNGNVGIGTTNPQYKVHTTGTLLLDTYNAYAIRATNASGTYAPVFATSGNHTYYYNTNASGYLYWRNAADNGTIFAISNSGQIGIGNTAPSYPLHVSLADGNFIAAQNQTNNIASTNVWGYGLYEGGSKLGEISLVRDGSSAQMYIGTTGANQQLRIGVGNKSEAIRIDANRIVYIMGATPSINNSLQMQYNSTAGSAEIYAKSTGGNTHFEFYTSNSGSTTEKMRINNLGNVGIGTTSPARHLDIREQEQTYSGVLKLSSAWTGSNVWVERLFAASFIRQTQEVGVDLLSLGSIGGNSHVLIEVSILAVAATAQQSAKITFFAGARQTSGGGYGSHYVTNPVVTAIQGSNISAGTPAWQGNTLIYTTYSQSNYTRYQVDFRVTCHDYMNITFEL